MFESDALLLLHFLPRCHLRHRTPLTLIPTTIPESVHSYLPLLAILYRNFLPHLLGLLHLFPNHALISLTVPRPSLVIQSQLLPQLSLPLLQALS